MPDTWLRRIAQEAVRLGTLFQELGYFGRGSVDAIIVGDGPSDWRLHCRRAERYRSRQI